MANWYILLNGIWYIFYVVDFGSHSLLLAQDRPLLYYLTLDLYLVYQGIGLRIWNISHGCMTWVETLILAYRTSIILLILKPTLLCRTCAYTCIHVVVYVQPTYNIIFVSEGHWRERYIAIIRFCERYECPATIFPSYLMKEKKLPPLSQSTSIAMNEIH